jgi:uncharacterized spore protein YtfJ
MADPDDVKVQLAANAATGKLIRRLAKRVGGKANAKAVFGDVVERDGVSVIPVARAIWGVGGGGGISAGEEGTGGGGGSFVQPIGFIEVRDGEAKFKPIRNRRMQLVSAVAAVLVAAVAIGRLARR